jgi:hypothetical protein
MPLPPSPTQIADQVKLDRKETPDLKKRPAPMKVVEVDSLINEITAIPSETAEWAEEAPADLSAAEVALERIKADHRARQGDQTKTSAVNLLPNAEVLTEEQIIALTRSWVEQVVIGLNLCPFAKTVHIKNQILYLVSHARDDVGLATDLQHAFALLTETAEEKIDTLLLIHPWLLSTSLTTIIS